jgi:hypothetical protein
MRRFLVVLCLAGTSVLALSSVASGAPTVRCKNGLTPTCAVRCKHGLTPTCTAPVIRVKGLGVACHTPGSSFKLPPITITSNVGLRHVRITLGSRVLRNLHYRPPGPTKKVYRHVRVSTSGLSAGLHSLMIAATDFNHKTSRRRLHFTVCPPAPVFTG